MILLFFRSFCRILPVRPAARPAGTYSRGSYAARRKKAGPDLLQESTPRRSTTPGQNETISPGMIDHARKTYSRPQGIQAPDRSTRRRTGCSPGPIDAPQSWTEYARRIDRPHAAIIARLQHDRPRPENITACSMISDTRPIISPHAVISIYRRDTAPEPGRITAAADQETRPASLYIEDPPGQDPPAMIGTDQRTQEARRTCSSTSYII